MGNNLIVQPFSSQHVDNMSSSQEGRLALNPQHLVSICETKLDNQFEPSFRDTRDRNSQQETALPTHWNKNKKQYRDASRVVSKAFAEDMSYPASARNIPNNVRRSKASWQDDDIDTTCHQTNLPIQLRQSRKESWCVHANGGMRDSDSTCCVSRVDRVAKHSPCSSALGGPFRQFRSFQRKSRKNGFCGGFEAQNCPQEDFREKHALLLS